MNLTLTFWTFRTVSEAVVKMICSERDFRHTIETMTTAMVTAQLIQTLVGGLTESGHFDTMKDSK